MIGSEITAIYDPLDQRRRLRSSGDISVGGYLQRAAELNADAVADVYHDRSSQ